MSDPSTPAAPGKGASITPPKIPRGSRSLAGFVVALLVTALAVLAAVAAIEIKLGHRRTVLGDTGAVAGWLRDQHWDGTVPFVIGIALAVVGVWLLLTAVLPARRRLMPLEDAPAGTTAGVTRRGLRREVAATATGVDGIDKAKARVRRGRVKVRARTALRDQTGLDDAVRDAVEHDLSELAVRGRRRVRVRVKGSDD